MSINIRKKDGSRLKCSASLAYRTINNLSKDTGYEIGSSEFDDELIRVSKPKDAPLHNDFTWSKDEALRKVQRLEAKYIVRSIEVIPVKTGVPVRAYESITVEEATPKEIIKKKIYRRTEEALEDPAMRAEILSNAIRDALAFRKKYAALQELSQVIQVIDKVIAKFG